MAQGDSVIHITEFHSFPLPMTRAKASDEGEGRQYAAQSFWWSSSRTKGLKSEKERDLNAWPAPFDQPFYLIMNVAVGGRFLGPPDKTTVFPAEMVIDYVRLYEKAGGYGNTKPRGAGTLPFGKP